MKMYPINIETGEIDQSEGVAFEMAVVTGLRPILTYEQIEQAIRDKYPKTPGERRCANEKKTMTELRQWYRDKLTKQNEDNAAYNRQILASAI